MIQHDTDSDGLQQPLTASNGQTGLVNLGNSCYMNSALQCLLHIPELNYYFLSGHYKHEINYDNPLGNGGRIAEIFAQLIHHLFGAKRSHPHSFSPRDFKHTIGRFNSMFSSYHQQDSQEFLSYLLDGLHEDLNRILKKPYTEKPELTNTEHVELDQIKELAAKSWETHKLRNDSIINDLFVGLYKSTLVCPECKKISITFDPYNALTLPLPTDQRWSHKVLILPEEGYPKSFEIELTKKATFNDLKNYLSEKLSIPVSELICMEVFNHQYFKNYESNDADIGYMPIEGLIQQNDFIVIYQLKHSPGDLVVPVLNTYANADGSEAKPFGIPFFITLSEEDRHSFGTIREKLEKRYDQLSTYNYFTAVRSKQKKAYHSIKDFPLLDEKLGEYYEGRANSKEQVDPEGYDSDISLANPDIPGDYAFCIKLYDSSKEPKYKYSSYNHYDVDDDDELWVPKTSNNFSRLPSLIEKLSVDKKQFYTYKENMFEDSSSSPASGHNSMSLVGSATDGDFPGLDEAIDSMDKSSGDEAEGERQEDQEMSLEPAIHSLLDSEPESSNLTPSTDSSNNTTHTNLTPDELSELQNEKPPLSLISEKVALVCEWQQELFDTFFAGIEEEGEGGKETWTNPEEIPNHELIQRRLMEEARNKENTNITLYDCLKLFEQPEVLSDQDLWYCPSCKKHTNATKSLEIWSTPDILTVHLKRFESQRSLSDKIDDVVEFPISGLDVAPYVVSDDGTETIYDLFAVDNHYGGLGGGHYTAFVKNFVDGNWYYFDDSRVHPRDPEESVTGNAYLLFYRRRNEAQVLGDDSLKELIQNQKEKQEAEMKADFERIEKLRAELHLKQKLEAEEAERQKAEAQTRAQEEAEEGDDEAEETTRNPSSEDSNSSTVSGNVVPPTNVFNAPPTILHPHPNLASASSTTTNPPLRKKRKGNVSSPILSPLQPIDDTLAISYESDAESLKEGFSPHLVPTTTGTRLYQSSGLVESPISTFDNDEDDGNEE